MNKELKIFLLVIGLAILIFAYTFFSVTLQKNKEKEVIETQKNKELQIFREKQEALEQQKVDNIRAEQQKKGDLDQCLALAAKLVDEAWKATCKKLYDQQMNSYKKCQAELTEMENSSYMSPLAKALSTKPSECRSLFPKPLEQSGYCLMDGIAESLADSKDDCYKSYK